MDEQEERIQQLELELKKVKDRLASEQADRLRLWPRVEASDKYLGLLKRATEIIRICRPILAAVELKKTDLLLADIAETLRIRTPQVATLETIQRRYENQPCAACGRSEGATHVPGAPFKRCNLCGYAG